MQRLARRALPALVVAAMAAASSPARATPPIGVLGKPSYVGITTDIGMPDILSLAVTVRPLWWLRLSGGGNTTLWSGGLGGGVTFVPLKRLLSPSLTLDAGHVFATDVGGIPKTFGIGVTAQRVGFDYASAHAGLEIGAQRKYTISIRAGASFLNLDSDPDGTMPSSFSHANLRVWTFSGKVAFTVFL